MTVPEASASVNTCCTCCAHPPGCLCPQGSDLFALYKAMFDARYSGNKAPMGVFNSASSLLNNRPAVDQINRFLDYALSHDNVWVVTPTQVGARCLWEGSRGPWVPWVGSNGCAEPPLAPATGSALASCLQGLAACAAQAAAAV
jgi:hypothetical protein